MTKLQKQMALQTIAVCGIGMIVLYALIILFNKPVATIADSAESIRSGSVTAETFLPEHSFTFVKTASSATPLMVQRVIVKRNDGALFSALAAWNARFYPGEKVMVQEVTYPTNLNIESAWDTKMLVATPLDPPPPDPNVKN